MTDTSEERLNKVLALELGVSRREADEMISRGRVTINATPAIIGARLHPNDTIHVDGNLVSRTTNFRYILFHKPVGYVCSRKSQGDTPTIYSLLPSELMHSSLSVDSTRIAQGFLS